MSNRSRPRVTGRDVAGAGAFMLSANLLCAAIGVGIGALVGATLTLGVAGFLVGFFVGMWLVTKRFRNV